MKALLLLGFFLRLLFGCSHGDNSAISRFGSVEIDDPITNNPVQLKTDPEVLVGPQKKDETKASPTNTRAPIVGLILGPGGKMVLSYLGLLRAMEKHGISFHLISGIGASGLLASLYAKENSSLKLEWLLFKWLRRDTANDSWQFEDIIGKRELREYLKNDHFIDYPVTTYLPLFDRDSGNVKESIRERTIPVLQKWMAGDNQTVVPAYKQGYSLVTGLKEKGADLVLFCEVAGSYRNAQKTSGLVDYLEGEKRKSDLVITLGGNEEGSMQDQIKLGVNLGKEIDTKYNKIINKWKRQDE